MRLGNEFSLSWDRMIGEMFASVSGYLHPQQRSAFVFLDRWEPLFVVSQLEDQYLYQLKPRSLDKQRIYS